MSKAGMSKRDPILIRSDMLVCAGCKRNQFRLPTWEHGNPGGKGEDCEHCGCTSFTIRPGRPWGPRSKFWEVALRLYREAIECGWFRDIGERAAKHVVFAARKGLVRG